jgi:nucleoside phosphorylase
MLSESQNVDVLVIAALKEEFDALLEVTGGEEAWEKFSNQNFTKYYFRDFESEQGFSFRVAAMWAHKMGATAAAALATELTRELSPRCLAMCGICAGKRDDVFLGDVLVADRVFRYDEGKLKVQREDKVFQPDLTTFNLKPKWTTAVQGMINKWRPSFINERPLSIDYQSNWLLRVLAAFEQNGESHPNKHPDINRYCPNRKAAMERLREKEWIEKQGFKLTIKGRQGLEESQFYSPDSPELDPDFSIHLGPIATGTGVQQDPLIFNKIAEFQRKIIGLEMEGEAIGIVSEIQELDYMVFVKGVCDYADEFKDDSFRQFAAKASADFLISFLIKYLPKKDPAPNSVESDRAKLVRKSQQVMEQVSNRIGGQVHLHRANQLEELEKACTEYRVTVLLGISGVGKSSLARDYAEKLIGENQSVLWFEARSFEKIDFASFEADLQLTNSLESMIKTLSNEPAILILDGIDRLYDPNSFKLLSTFLRLFNFHEQSSSWILLVTCQTQEWSRLCENLMRESILTNEWQIFRCNPLSIDQLEPIWQEFPSANRLKYQTHLREIFGNLKILDLVTIRLSLGDDVQVGTWVGESSVATWFCDSEIARGNEGPARVRFVQLLAERQAETLKQAIPIHTFEVSQLQLIEKLFSENICSETPDNSIVFQHDLYGEWSRFRLLVSHNDDLVNYLRERLTFPMWHRALRLYGLYLLEHIGDISQWHETLDTFADEANLLAQDILLEAPVFAANPLPLLELIRSNLIENEGLLLKRLLTRFLVSATLPDPQYLEIARAQGFDETKFSATFRYPHWPFWPAMLRFIYEHHEEFIVKAPVEIGQIVKLWLDYAPHGTILRQEAAEIGLLLGEKALLAQKDYSSSIYKDRKQFYYVALAGARELPDLVSDFALRASQRTGEISSEDNEGQGSILVSIITSSDPRFDPNEPLPEPYPDGPRRNVDDDFRKVILEGKTLWPLIHVNPAVAREVTLAVLICHRRRYEWASGWSARDWLELEDIINWSPSLYTHGPFLAFLQINFLEGLELIARLVDFTTDRWKHRTEIEANEYVEEQEERDTNEFLAQFVKESCRHPGIIVLLIDNVEREFIGDSRVYGWSAGLGNIPHTVKVALMALEKYFYLRIDQEQPIDEDILTVLRRVKSVAFLKVLCDVGKRLPTLFENSLQPILSVPEIYFWEERMILEARSHLMIGLSLEQEPFFQLAKQFNNLEHRQKYLRQIALELFFNSPAMRAFFEQTRQRWETRFLVNSEDEIRDFLQQLILSFDINNYQIQQDSEYGNIIINTKVNDLQADRADELRNNEFNLLILIFPMRCRMYLNRQETLTENDIEQFWEQVQQIISIGDGDDSYQNNQYTPSKIAACVCGGIAVLFHFFRNWLAQYPERKQWCLDYIRDIVLDPPPSEPFDLPESPADSTWDCFVAEALPLIWAEDKDNEEARYLIARMVFARHYKAVNILFCRCAELRSILFEDFTRLRRLLFAWAFVRNRIAFVEGFKIERELIQQFSEEVNKWEEEQLEAFVKAVTPSTIYTWRLMDESDRFRAIDETIPRRQYDLDFQLIQAAHAWLPTLDKVTNAEERCNIIEFWSEALSYVMRRVSVSGEGNQWHSENFYPNKLERWVLEGVGIAILYMDLNEQPEKLWQSILDLPQAAHYWSEILMQTFHQYGLQQTSIPLNYVATTRAILNYVLPRESADFKWSYHAEVWEELIGIGRFSIDKWDERHSSLIKEMRCLFEDWFRRIPISKHRIALFAKWLKKPVADPIRFKAILWFEEMLKQGKLDYILKEKSITEALACLLNTIWVRDQNRLRQNKSVFEAFCHLLRLLTDQQDEIALELCRRIAGS